MTIRIHSPYQLSEQFQHEIDEKMVNLQRFFDRIKSAEVYIQETQAEKARKNSKEVALKVHFMRRVLYVSERAKDFEQAFLKAADKMRQQLKAYEQEIRIF